MPDLDRDLALLSTELRDTVRQPDLDRVIERSRQRTTRRRTQLGAILAVLAVAAAIPLLRTSLRPAADRPVTPATTESVQLPLESPYLLDIDFADERHGYALKTTCINGRPAGCANQLLVTADGEHWEARALPRVLSGANALPLLRVLGPNTVVLRREAVVGLQFYSTDAGRTWQEVSWRDMPTIDAVPAGGIIDGMCAAGESGCRFELIAIDPGTGRAARLATQPPVSSPNLLTRHPVAGGWWVYGKERSSGQWEVIETQDSGRSWKGHVLPAGSAEHFSLATDGHALYVAAYGQLANLTPPRTIGLDAIFRSTDGGASWQRTWKAADGVEPRAIDGDLIAAANGRLLVSTYLGPVWASSDGGARFQQAPEVGISGYVWQTGAGYLVGSRAGESKVYKFSTDGVRWKEISVG
jgi:hypothetical protein